MLLRLITVISLILFMLLMISGLSISLALYRSLLVFMVMFTIVYLAIFLMNVVKGGDKAKPATVSGNDTNAESNGEE